MESGVTVDKEIGNVNWNGYLDCCAQVKFEGLGLPILKIHLQNIRQEEEGVALVTTPHTRGQGSG